MGDRHLVAEAAASRRRCAAPPLFRRAALAFIVLLALFPVAQTVRIVAQSGENNLSNDYIFSLATVDKAFSGELGPGAFLRESWLRSHFTPVSTLASLAVARLFDWDVRAEILIGLGLLLARTGLFLDLLLGDRKDWRRWAALPVLTWLFFSPSQLTVLTWGAIALSFNLLFLLGTLGLWGLYRCRREGAALAFMVLGGLGASWTWGAGMACWPVYLAAMILLGYRRARQYALWGAAAATAALPYVHFLGRSGFRDPASGAGMDLLNVRFFLQTLGSPLAENPGAEALNAREQIVLANPEISAQVGLAGLSLLAIGCLAAVLASQRRRPPPVPGTEPQESAAPAGGFPREVATRTRWLAEECVPALALSLWGAAGAWLISVGRGTGPLAPWYNAVAVMFWAGLAGLFWVCACRRIPPPAGRLPWLGAALAILPLGVIGVLFARSNILSVSFSPFYLPSRAPVSAACLRSHATAPTYCEETLFQWGLGRPELVHTLGLPLERHGLSAFSPRQTWTLQGDYLFANRVRLRRTDGDPQISWREGLEGERRRWSSYRRLDVRLDAPSTLSWTVDLPADLERAELRTAVGVPRPAAPGGAPVRFRVGIASGGKEETVFEKAVGASTPGWHPLSIPLERHRGERVTILLRADGQAGMFRQPRLELRLPRNRRPRGAPAPHAPENVRAPDGPAAAAAGDLILENRPGIWRTGSLRSNPEADGPGRRGDGTYAATIPQLNACLGRYSEFEITLRVPAGARRHHARVTLGVDGHLPAVFELPLLADGREHAYSYPVRLLDAVMSARLTRVSVAFLPDAALGRAGIDFRGARLIASPDPAPCDLPSLYIPPQETTTVIPGAGTVDQDFVSECAGAIDQVGLFMAAAPESGRPPLTLTLDEAASGTVLRRSRVDGTAERDRRWLVFPIDPLATSPGDRYRLRLGAPERVTGNSAAVYRSAVDAYPDGSARAAGLTTPADLVFRYRCLPVPSADAASLGPGGTSD